MPRLDLKSFKYGLDTRRDALTSQPGTLLRCENGHVNTGGEIDKRYAFVEHKDVSVLDDSGNQGTFGLEVTSAGFVVFGSALDDGAAGQSQVRLAGASVGVSIMPAGVTYQQLKHPTIYFTTTEAYAAARHRMTAVVFSALFNGNTFVAATFTDGATFLYYNGEPIANSYDGFTHVYAAGTGRIQELSDELLRQIEELGWQGHANRSIVELASVTNGGSGRTATCTTKKAHGFSSTQLVEITGVQPSEYNGVFPVIVTGTYTFTYEMGRQPNPNTAGSNATSPADVMKCTIVEAGTTVIKSPVSNYFTALPEEDAVSGAVGAKEDSRDGAGSAGYPSQAGFRITGNSGTFTMTAPLNSDGTGTADISGGAVAAQSTDILTASAIVDAINSTTYIYGYTAVLGTAIANGVFFVYAPLSWGKVTYNVTCTYTTGTVVVVSTNFPVPMSVVLVPSTPFPPPAETLGSTSNFQISGSVTAVISGGTAPYRVFWSPIGQPQNVTVPDATAPTATFIVSFTNVPRGATVVASAGYICTVEDSNNQEGQVTVSVVYTYRNVL